ncbi:unnamed protein product [Trichogramma brassicae]|uniref:Uncharacterized protein n=1 Tax=Trichogramma brassicae TaxID=86971 RepID=A0A6H5IK51_9HYME|nr:unnamed protein product [Trichogramma brassicae]
MDDDRELVTTVKKACPVSISLSFGCISSLRAVCYTRSRGSFRTRSNEKNKVIPYTVYCERNRKTSLGVRLIQTNDDRQNRSGWKTSHRVRGSHGLRARARRRRRRARPADVASHDGAAWRGLHGSPTDQLPFSSLQQIRPQLHGRRGLDAFSCGLRKGLGRRRREVPRVRTEPEFTSARIRRSAADFGCLKQENEEVFELLLRNGADPNSTDTKGSTSLHVIALCLENMMETSFVFGNNDNQSVNIDAQDNLGNAPLHLALRCRPMIAPLLERGANPNLANAEGFTPLRDIGRKRRDDGLIELFFEMSAKFHRRVQINARDKKGGRIHLFNGPRRGRRPLGSWRRSVRLRFSLTRMPSSKDDPTKIRSVPRI